ncbi:LysR family transcriptional regulator [Xylophilus sp. GOD-11R]|uniref:LysR family transcriptional regulator n=1 Tax=Xylophilus sp. GOD-11R TaxID=3089814 RepID=UPI00298BDD21|nr:LysR family transcriptional regulator [Xylophilus sp. GOD-11R]WPB56389.1 LysR family transcriptional regulator [Xylophilus sp. GOD-11R]
MILAAIDLQTLRTFVAVAQEGSVSRAAVRLHRSQPAVSLQLKRLADMTGLVLFQRTAHGLVLSADGAALLPQAERVMAATDDFAQAAGRLHGTVRGQLRIGTILEPPFIRLGDFLGELVDAAPQVATELRHGMSGDVLAQVQHGDLDVGFYLAPSLETTRALQPELAVRTLNRFTYRVVGPAGWGPQLQGRDWEGLAALPWLGTPPESVHHRLLGDVFGPRGLSPRLAALVDQESSMLDLIKSGVGLSLVRDAIAMRESQTHGLAVADRVMLPCELQFVSLASRVQEPALAAAWEALERVWRR